MVDFKIVDGERVALTPEEQAEHDARTREFTMNKHTDQAIRNTHPTIVKVVYNDPIEAYDASEKPVAIDMAAAEAEIAVLEAAENAVAYRELRAKAYPPVGDQLDALWKGGQEQAAMKAVIDKVKSDYPKPA